MSTGHRAEAQSPQDTRLSWSANGGLWCWPRAVAGGRWPCGGDAGGSAYDSSHQTHFLQLRRSSDLGRGEAGCPRGRPRRPLCELTPAPPLPSAFQWPPHCPGQTGGAHASWTRRRHGWTGPRARTRGSCPPARWSLWRECQGLDSTPPRRGYGYCSQGRTHLREGGRGRTDRGREGDRHTDGRREKRLELGGSRRW